MALNVGTFSSAFGALLNAAKTMDHSGGCIALPLLGERVGVREVHLSPTMMKRCAREREDHEPSRVAAGRRGHGVRGFQ